MKITELVSKPKLISITIDDAETVKEFGEALEFWTHDRQPLDQFLKLSNNLNKDQAAAIEVIKTMVLDEKGKQILTGEELLPISVMVKVMAKIMDRLGN